jgi:hypothetical protein
MKKSARKLFGFKALEKIERAGFLAERARIGGYQLMREHWEGTLEDLVADNLHRVPLRRMTKYEQEGRTRAVLASL